MNTPTTTMPQAPIGEDIRSMIASAVSDAVRKEMGGVVLELAWSFSVEFRKGLSDMMMEF